MQIETPQKSCIFLLDNNLRALLLDCYLCLVVPEAWVSSVTTAVFVLDVICAIAYKNPGENLVYASVLIRISVDLLFLKDCVYLPAQLCARPLGIFMKFDGLISEKFIHHSDHIMVLCYVLWVLNSSSFRKQNFSSYIYIQWKVADATVLFLNTYMMNFFFHCIFFLILLLLFSVTFELS